MKIRFAGPAVVAVALALTSMVAAPAAQADDTGQPCPKIVRVNQRATLICNDGTVTFDLSAMKEGVSYDTPVMAGSHRVLVANKSNNQLKLWTDKPTVAADGTITYKITILEILTDEVKVLG